MKNAHLRRFPHPSSLRRTCKYASFLRMSGALHLGIFDQPEEIEFFRKLLEKRVAGSAVVFLRSGRTGVMMLTPGERERYDRQIIIEGFGQEGQEKLKQSRVAVAGAGGLGSPVATYLAAAGVGMIRMIDHDRVELSNLNRQVLHWEEDIGRRKVDSAGTKLRNLNSAVKIEAIAETITEGTVSRLVDGCDVLVDAMDNLATRYILNRYAVEKRIPFFHGAVHGFEGRAMTILPGKTACLRCMYRGPVPQEKFPVIGIAPAVIGSIQAAEVIKYLIGTGKLLTNRLLIFDGLRAAFTEFGVNRNPNCDHCGSFEGKE